MLYSQTPTNVSVTTATVINSFPYTETNVNTNGGGTATGMNGSCNTLPCCSTLVYRVEVPTYGSLRVESNNFVPLAGSAIAYTPDIDNPQTWSDLTYFPSWGNFCGFRDTMEIGIDYNWTSHIWDPNPDISDSNRVIPPGVYYILLFNHNQQASLGAVSDFTFEFAPYCPDGYSCSFENVTLCEGGGYLSPSGNLYTTSGNYQDTLFGAANGGLDSLIFTNLSINHTAYDQDVITDETLCAATDTLRQPAQTERVSFIDLDRSSSNWVQCNSAIPSLINTNRSVFGWMKKSTTVSGSSQILVGMNTSGTSTICNLLIGTNEKVGIYDGSNYHYTSSVVTDGQWHFVGYTYDESTNLTKMYVDGVMESSYTNGQSISSTTDRLSLGQEFDGSTVSNILDGILTEVSIWNELLDSAEIAQIMNSAIESSHPKYANLQAYYPMMTTCGADDQVVVDFSGNNNSGFASHSGIQQSDTMEIIPGFNAAPHYSKNWIVGGTSVSTDDTLELTTYTAGNYKLELTRDYYKITDDWTVTIGCAGSPSDIVITEISYNPPESGSDSTEFIELYNAGPGVVDLEGFHFTSGMVYTFPPSVSLNSGEYLVIGVDSVALKNTYNYTTARQWTTGGLSNGGEPISLKDNLGNMVDSLRYDDVFPWPTAADGAGPSMVLCDPTSDNKDGANWIASGTDISVTVNGKKIYGSPGSADNGCSGCVNTSSTISPVACNSYVSPSTNYTWTTSGTYMDTIPNNAGCDSVITVNLTINNSSTGIDTQIACDSYTWIDGNTYTTSNNTATHTLTNAVGCDSVVTLNLTINSLPVITQQPQNTAVDVGNDATFTVQTSGGSYDLQWGLLDVTFSNKTTTDGLGANICRGITLDNGIIYAGTDGGLSISSDGGISFSNKTTADGLGHNQCYDVEVSASNTIWIATHGGVSYSTDGGNSFINKTTADGLPSNYGRDIHIDGNNIYLAYFGGFSYSNDGGTTFINRSTSDGMGSNLCNGVFAEGNNVYVATLNGLSISNDGGVTFTYKTTADGLIHDQCYGVYASGGTIYIATRAGLSITSDGGNTFVNKTSADGLGSSMCLGGIYFTNGKLYVSTNGGISISEDGGNSFINYNTSNGLGHNACRNVDVVDDIIYVGNFGGLSISSDFTELSGETNATLILPSVTLSMDGNEYAVRITNSTTGCEIRSDSAVLTVSPCSPTSGTDTQTACDSYVWIDGNTYSASNNTATHTLTNAAGCDSIVTLNLTINNSNTGIDTQVACDSFTWIDGITYTSSNNTATHTLTNVAGCDSIVTLNLTVNNSNTGIDTQIACDSYTWIDGITYTASNNSATHTLTNAAGCDSIVTLNLTINNSSAGIDTQVACDSYTWIDGNTYTTSNNTATYTLVNSVGCDSIVTLNLTINNSVTYNAPGIAACDSAQINGNWYNTSQTVTDIFTGGASTGCDSTVYTVLTIQNSPVANAGVDDIICEDNTYVLSGSASNELSILWTTSGDGVFDDASKLNAIYTPGVGDIGSGSLDLTLTAYSISPCATDAVDNMTLTIQQLPVANAGSDDVICENDTYTLSGIASDQQNVIWTTAGDGTFDDATSLGAIYTPGANDISAGTVDLTLTSYSIAPCINDSVDTMTLTIQPLPTASAGTDAVVCETGSYSLTGIASDYQSVHWTTSGDGSFDDATLLTPVYTPGANDIVNGTVDLTLTAYSISPCTVDASDNMTLTIQYNPIANAGADATICETDTYTLSGTSSNEESVIWTSAGDGTFDDATSLGAIYTPGANDILAGSVQLTLTSIAMAPCADNDTDEMIITIQYLPEADAGADDVVCESGTYQLSGVATYQQNVLWTTSGDGTFDDASLLTAIYTPGSNDILTGTVDLTLTAYATLPCTVDASDNITLSVQLLPEADAGIDAVICETDTYNLAGIASNYESVLWTTSGDGTFSDATSLTAVYTPGTNDIDNGYADLTLTSVAIAPCTDNSSDDMQIVIQLLPVADAGTDATICEVDTYTLSGTATDEESLLWTTSGDGSFDDPTIPGATYAPGVNDLANGSVNLTLTAYAISPCVAESSDVMLLLIQDQATSNAGPDGEVCEGESYTLSGTATNQTHVYWATSGDGVYDDPFLLNASYTPGVQDVENGDVTLTMFAYSIQPCYYEEGDEMLLTILNIASANAGSDATICENNTHTLDGQVRNNNGQLWTTAGDGTFDDATLPGATYTPGTTDIANGEVELTLTAFSNPDCGGDATDILVLTIEKMPEQPQLPDGPTAIDLDLTTSTEYTINSVENADYYHWELSPIEAGTIEGTDTIGTAYWNSDYTGLIAQIFVMVENDYCDPVYSETLEIGISPVSILNAEGQEMEIIISPNPSGGRFNVRVTGATDDIDLVIINSTGQRIKELKLLNTLGSYTADVDISTNPAGNYYLKFITNKGVITRKVSINKLFR